MALLETVMGEQGFALDDLGWYFGHKYRDFTFPTGRKLTVSLKLNTPQGVVFQWLKLHKPFEPLPDINTLSSFSLEKYKRANRKVLSVKRKTSSSNSLPRLSDINLELLNEKCEEIISKTKLAVESQPGVRLFGSPGGYTPLWFWSNRLWYQSGIDTWTNEEWWLQIASRRWEQDKNQIAAVALLKNGRMEPKKELLQRMREFEVWESEAFEDLLLWVLENEVPWPFDTHDDLPVFSMTLGDIPPPIARKNVMLLRESMHKFRNSADGREKQNYLMRAFDCAAELNAKSASVWMKPEEITELHESCIDWASEENDSLSLMSGSPLLTAANFAWPEILEKLSVNRAFLEAHLDSDLAFYSIGSLALRLSSIKPCELAVRFVDRAMNGEFEATLEKVVARVSGTTDLTIRDSLRIGFKHSRKMDEFAAAIAWTRCRDKLPL